MSPVTKNSRGGAATAAALRPVAPGRSLHEAVVAHLRQLLTTCQPGDRLPPVRELLRRLNVSMTTLRAAQAVLAHEGLIELRQGAGVTVRRVPGQTTGLRVGILSELNLLEGRTSTYFRTLGTALLQALRERGYRPRLYIGTVRAGILPRETTCPEFWADAETGQLDAAILTNLPSIWDCAKRVQGLTIPAVGDRTAYCAATPDETMLEPGLRLLQAQGVRRVALLGGRERAPAFKSLARQLGLATAPGWLGADVHPLATGAGWEVFREEWSARPEKPDGLLISDEALFDGAAEAISELRIAVPHALRVVALGHGQEEHAPAPFAHTRLVFNPGAAAQMAVDLLARRLAGEPPPAHKPQLHWERVEVSPVAMPLPASPEPLPDSTPQPLPATAESAAGPAALAPARLRPSTAGHFTLVELLVVIAIIGILAAMLLPALNEARQKAILISCLNNQKQMHIGLVAYTDDNNSIFPPGGFYAGDQLEAPLHLTGNARVWPARPDAAGWPGTGTIYQFMGRVIFHGYLSKEIMLDPGAVRGPNTETPVTWYPAAVGWDKFAYVAPTAARPSDETMPPSASANPGVVGWYNQYFHDYRDTPGWHMPRRMGRTPTGGSAAPTAKATTAMVLCYQEGAWINDGLGLRVANNGSHQRRSINALYEDGHARSLPNFGNRKAALDAQGQWTTTREANPGLSYNYWKWAMTEDGN